MEPAKPPGSRPRARDAVSAVVTLLRDPDRLDQVLVLGEVVNAGSIDRILARFEDDPDGRDLLARRPSIDSQSVDFAGLAALPDGTLGCEYARFLRDHGISPDAWPPPRMTTDRATWLGQRLRQTHDILHVVTGCAPDVPGEIVLQAFTFAQTGAPSSLLIALLGSLKHRARHPGLPGRAWRAWRAGRHARFLGPVPWESLWHDRIEALRARFAIERFT